jgi:hypothetical protein
MRLCAEPKGYPHKDFVGIFVYEYLYDETALRYSSFLKSLDNENFKENINYRIFYNHGISKNQISNFKLYQSIIRNYKINLLFQPKLFIFSDKKPTNKFSTFYLDDNILVEYNSLNYYINILNQIIL